MTGVKTCALPIYRSIAYNKDGSPKTVGDIYNWAGKKMGISPKSNIEDYSEVYITPDFTNLETPIQTPTFAEQEQEVDKDVAEVEQKTNEYNFLEELYKSPQRQEEQQQEQVQQAPQTNLLESFAQISEFVEAPLFRQGGQYTENESAFLEEIKGLPISKDGVFASGDKPVVVPSPSISMKGVSYPILGKSLETGETKTMFPNMEYFFKNTQNVVEYPLKK